MNTVTVHVGFGDELRVAIPKEGPYRQVVHDALAVIRRTHHRELPVTGVLTQSPLGRYELTGVQNRPLTWKAGAFK